MTDVLLEKPSPQPSPKGRGGIVRLGAIGFINTLPVYANLPESEGLTVHYDSPTSLNQAMAEGLLDVSPVSSAFYLRHQKDFVLLDNLSVSSSGSVESVLFLSRKKWGPELSNFANIAVPDDSETSVALLAYLLQGQTGSPMNSRFYVYPAQDWQQAMATHDNALVIGDEALKVTHGDKPEGIYSYDLSALWHQNTGLPFVFAVWVARKEWASEHFGELVMINKSLCASRERFFEDPGFMEQSVVKAQRQCAISQEAILNYWSQSLEYVLTDAHHRSLEKFAGVL